MELQEATLGPEGPIHHAAKEGDVGTLKKASRKDLNKEDSDGWIPLHWAVWIGNVEAAKVIILRGGEIDKCNAIGRTALHIAAGYGQVRCIQLLIEGGANIFALDNRGQTPALVALENGRVECSRQLNMLAAKMQMHNPELVSKLKIKAYKDLQKRVKREETKAKKNLKKRHTSQGTLFGETSTMPHDKTRHNSDPRLGHKKLSAVQELQNFELRPASSAENVRKESKESNSLQVDTEQQDSQSANIPPLNDGQALASFKPLQPKVSRGMLESLKSLPDQPVPAKSKEKRASSSSVVPAGMSVSNSVSSQMSAQTYSGAFPQPVLVENDSPLATFLQSLGIGEIAQKLYEEKMDLSALMLCDENDFASIGLPLGPRKRLLAAIKTRREKLTNPGKMVDTSI